jgi:glutathione peroxidase-family protein
VIIAIPTKDFDSSIVDNSQLLALYNSLHLNYIMSKLMAVKENLQDPLYTWLTHEVNNGVMDAPVNGDFFKILIDPQGKFKGVLSGRVTPLEPLLLGSLKN